MAVKDEALIRAYLADLERVREDNEGSFYTFYTDGMIDALRWVLNEEDKTHEELGIAAEGEAAADRQRWRFHTRVIAQYSVDQFRALPDWCVAAPSTEVYQPLGKWTSETVITLSMSTEMWEKVKEYPHLDHSQDVQKIPVTE